MIILSIIFEFLISTVCGTCNNSQIFIVWISQWAALFYFLPAIIFQIKHFDDKAMSAFSKGAIILMVGGVLARFVV